MRKIITTAIAVTAISLSGCSSKPRTFTAQLAAPPTDAADFEAWQSQCRDYALEATKNGSNRLASAGAGVAAGAGAAAVGAAATSGTYASYAGAAAAGGVMIMAVPIVGVAAAWGISKAKRAKKERRIKEATSSCLAEQGYEVAGWDKVKKAKSPSKQQQVAAAQ